MTRVSRDLGISTPCQQVGWGPPSPRKISVDPRSSAAKVFAVAFAENCFSKSPAPNRSSPVTTGVKRDFGASNTCQQVGWGPSPSRLLLPVPPALLNRDGGNFFARVARHPHDA